MWRCYGEHYGPHHAVVQSLSHVWLFLIPWTAARQASLSVTISWSLLELMSIELVMLSNHLVLCHPLPLLPSVFPRIRVFFNELALPLQNLALLISFKFFSGQASWKIPEEKLWSSINYWFNKFNIKQFFWKIKRGKNMLEKYLWVYVFFQHLLSELSWLCLIHHLEAYIKEIWCNDLWAETIFMLKFELIFSMVLLLFTCKR